MEGTGGIGASGPGGRKATKAHLPPLAAFVLSMALALLLGALSLLVMLPAKRHMESLAEGRRAEATLVRAGSCMAGSCRVEFEADGRTVVASLPVGSGGAKDPVGARIAVRYAADDPLTAAREDDTGGGGAAVLAALSGGAALLFLGLSGAMAVVRARQRRT